MSATTLGKTPAGPRQYRAPEHRLTFAGLVRSEWIKFWSVRSVVWTMVAAVLCTVGLAAAISALIAATSDGSDAGGPGGGLDISMVGAQMASLIVAAVGVIVIAGEFSTGMVRTSFTAAPRRLGVLAAKAVVLAVAVAVVLGAAVFAAFFLAQALLPEDLTTGIGDDDVLRLLLGNVAALVGIALAGLGLGALMRNTAGAICTIVALLFVVPTVLMFLPDFSGKDTITDYYFANTTTALTTSTAGVPEGMGGGLSVTTSAVAFTAWVLAFLAVGALAVRRRDV